MPSELIAGPAGGRLVCHNNAADEVCKCESYSRFSFCKPAAMCRMINKEIIPAVGLGSARFLT